MPITLDSLTFDEAHTAAREKLEEVGGREGRVVVLSGFVVGEPTPEAVEARLDAIAAAASDEDYAAILSLRPGRQMRVRRAAFNRSLVKGKLAGAFELTLESRLPFEESAEPLVQEWPIVANGDTLAVATPGTAPAPLRIVIAAQAQLLYPAIDDGVRSLTYRGAVGAGQTLTLDGEAACVTLDGEDVTAYTAGDFPMVRPGGSIVTFTDDEMSDHRAEVTVSHRARWW